MGCNCFHEPLIRCVKLRVAHAPGMPGTFSPPPTSKEAKNYIQENAFTEVYSELPFVISLLSLSMFYCHELLRLEYG